MKKILTVLMILLALIVFSSCTNDAKDPIEEETNSWETIFSKYWDAMSLEYVHFSEETDMDWDAVYEKYLPLFQKLDYTKKEDSISAFKYFKEMSWQLSDYHYALRITDNFGNYIQISPSTLQKMKKAQPDWDINDYPDIFSLSVTEKGSVISILSVNGGFENPVVKDVSASTDEEKATVRKFYSTTEGVVEVTELTNEGTFHNGTTGFTDSVGYTIKKPKTSADHTTLTDAEKAWTTVVTGLSLDEFTYFYGLTEDDIFYYYISQFPSSQVLEPLLYQENLTADERKTLEDKGLDYIHDALWCQNVKNGVTYDLSEERAQLEGILDLLKQLKYITATGKCSFDGYTWTEVSGVIMDVRSNGGGAADFLFKLMGSFFSEPTKIGSVRYRDSYSRYNYTPWIDFYLEKEYCNPVADTNYSGPFVVLANGSSVSCSEISCIIAKLLPSTKIVGGQTYGGTCALTDRTIFQSGPFDAGEVFIYTTTYQTVDSNGNNLETIGITPDVAVKYTDSSVDERFNAAIETIKGMLASV